MSVPNWGDILQEIVDQRRTDEHAIDNIRRKYLSALSDLTGRPIIAYYSGWLNKPGLPDTDINDDDKNGFIASEPNFISLFCDEACARRYEMKGGKFVDGDGQPYSPIWSAI